MTDTLIRWREVALDRLAAVGPDTALNHAVAGTGPQTVADPAAALKHALDDIKSAALDDAGDRVDYAVLAASPAYTQLRDHLGHQLAGFNPDELPDEASRRAFWINLYNALVLDAVIAFSVRRSVTEGLLGSLVFFRRAAYVVGGQRVSLDDIEHGILRDNRGHPFLPGTHFPADDPRRAWVLPLDPRIHFALNCGGVSCPPIRAYSGDRLDVQLATAARNFAGNTTIVEPAHTRVTLSRLFKWYERDFGGREQAAAFVCAHLPDDERRAYLSATPPTQLRLVYAPYDWRLNAI